MCPPTKLTVEALVVLRELISLHHFHRFTAQNDVALGKLALRHQQR